MYVAKYKCRLCNKIITGKLVNEDILDKIKNIGIDLIDMNIMTLILIDESCRFQEEKIPNNICHHTVGHIGIADFVGLEDYESYQLSQLNTEVS